MPDMFVIIDGNSLMHRAFHALPPLSNDDGVYTNAVFGFLSMLLKVMESEHPTHMAVAFDLHGPTFRHADYSEYKAGRKPTAPELRPQFDIVRECLTAMGIRILTSPTFEADDILGTIARRCEEGGIPALLEVEFSITDHRGCFGGCTFCAINFHQGRIIQNRSKESIVEEAKLMTSLPNFKGYIHDVGGPTGNFRNMSCKKQLKVGACKERQCLFPDICPNLEVDHKDYVDILRTVRKLDKVKKVFIRSGVRFDYIMADPDPTFFDEMCEYHISGLLKVAPEHVAPNALYYMGKPQRHVYEKFVKRYFAYNKRVGKEQYLVPYLMSSHPGCTLEDAVVLAEYVRDIGYNPEQVQDFIPTPGSMATAMYYSGYDPRTMQPVYVPRDPHEKAMQRALLQYRNPKNYDLVYEALV